jgi:predicted DNA-binding antitoxin AbrB/MazE fold protein
MTPLVPATYERGMFKPLTPLRLPEHLRVILVVTPSDGDVPTLLLDRLAEQSESFAFLNDPREDLYTAADGEPC